jgi:predicted TIM-barrel fold metal-dependent hydrolase
MAKSKWGNRIPQVIEVEGKGQLVHRWAVNGKPLQGRGVCDCPAVMNDPLRNGYPQRWEDVPSKAYVPTERLKALDADGFDAEVLFPNDPASFHQYEDAEFELESVRAYNDSVSEWHKSSDRFIPLAMVPLLSAMEAAVVEVERAAANRHRGIVMFALPSLLVERLPHISESYWYPYGTHVRISTCRSIFKPQKCFNDVTEEERRSIFWDNAARLNKIDSRKRG